MTKLKSHFSLAWHSFVIDPFHQLDIEKAFMHGDLEKEVNTVQPPGFVTQGEFGL